MRADPVFRDRPETEVGRILAERLGSLVPGSESLVLALPRGGVAVGHEVARAPRLPVDVFPVRNSDCRGGRNWRLAPLRAACA
jgi:putative phosphoribosyl transferase